MNNCLKPLINNNKKQRPILMSMDDYDSGQPYVHKEVLNYLEFQRITI